MATLSDLQAAFGNVAMLLSNLESHVATNLELLISQDCPLAGGLLVDHMTLSQRVQRTKDLAKLRFGHDHAMRDRICELMKEVDKVREQRNDFVHGLWSVDRLIYGELTCHDFKWRLASESHWQRADAEQWTLARFDSFATVISAISGKLMVLNGELQTAKMLPHTPPISSPD